MVWLFHSRNKGTINSICTNESIRVIRSKYSQTVAYPSLVPLREFIMFSATEGSSS